MRGESPLHLSMTVPEKGGLLRRASLAAACLSGAIPSVEREKDESMQLLLLGELDLLLPLVLEAEKGPIALCLSTLTSLFANRTESKTLGGIKWSFPVRMAAGRALEKAVGLLEPERLAKYFPGMASRLVLVPIGHASEQKRIPVYGLRLLFGAIKKAESTLSESDIDKLCVLMGRLRVLDAACPELRAEFLAAARDYLAGALSREPLKIVIIELAWSLLPLGDTLEITKPIADKLRDKYIAEPALHFTYLCQLLRCQPDTKDRELYRAMYEAIDSATLSTKVPVIVEFDSVNFDCMDSLDRALGSVPVESPQPLPWSFEGSMTKEAMFDAASLLSKLDDQYPSIIADKIVGSSDCLQKAKWMLMCSRPQDILDQVLEVDDTVGVREAHKRVRLVWLLCLDNFLCRLGCSELSHGQKGGILVQLLPKLLIEDPAERQVALRALSRLFGPSAESLGRVLAEYQPFISDSILQQLPLPLFFPSAPRLLSAWLTIADPGQGFDILRPVISQLCEGLELQQYADQEYCADSLRCLRLSVSICSRAHPTFLKRPVVLRGLDTEPQDFDKHGDDDQPLALNLQLAADILKTAVHFLSSDHPRSRALAVLIISDCTTYFESDARAKPHYLKSIHLVWERLSKRALDDDSRIAKPAAEALAALIRFDPPFVRSRIVDLWHSLERRSPKKDLLFPLLREVLVQKIEMPIDTVEDMFMFLARAGSPDAMAILEDAYAGSIYSDVLWYRIMHDPRFSGLKALPE